MTDASHPTLGSAIHALRRNWGWFVGLGGLSIVAGLLALGNVMIGTLVSVLFIGIMLIASGILRIIVAFGMRGHPGWAWMLLAGAVTLLLGLTIAAHWPTDSLWVLGIFLGIDLLFTGVALVSWGLRLKPTH